MSIRNDDQKMLCRLLLIGLLFISMISFSQQTAAQTHYLIRITEPAHHLADIEIDLEVQSAGSVDLKFPAWRTGKYQILDLANTVRKFRVESSKGEALSFQKVEKSTWRVNVSQPGWIKVYYQLYANQLELRSRHIDDTHAYINPSAFLMFTDESRPKPAVLQLEVPQGWRSVSGMDQGDNSHQFLAANYDVLADSPIETGVHQSFAFEQDQRKYQVVFWGDGNYDARQIVTDLQKLVAQAPTIWTGYPYQRYVFIIHATAGARGATEHLNSTVIQRERSTFRTREHYLQFLSTAAHELIHTWNVKAYRPAELVPYDYLQPNYSKLLWIAEGSTSYFQNQLLLRAGLMTHAEFYADLAKRIERFEQLPGAQFQSVAQSSFDNWISLSGHHADNFSVNIYSEGYLVSWLLDQWVLEQSNYQHSYRTVHDQLYQRFAKTTAFTEQDIKKIAFDLTGQSLDTFWQQYVESPLKPDFSALLSAAGLKLEKSKQQQAWSGLTSQYQQGVDKITRVLKDSPAWHAGITVDDEIVAVNALQLKVTMSERLKDFKPGDRVQLTFFRSGRLLTSTLILSAEAQKGAVILPVAKPNPQQQRYHQAWLGVKIEPAKK